MGFHKIYSKIDGTLLHVVNRFAEISENRVDLSPENEFLQVSCFKLNENKTFRSHKHLTLDRHTNVTQESWVVIKGKIKAILYDIDDKILEEVILDEGDCSITFRGGHNYLCLQDNTVVYEYKTGPYLGQKMDKVFI